MPHRTTFASAADRRTQRRLALDGVVSPEMERVAEREEMPAEEVCAEVARGRMVIPANHYHATLDPMAIGLRSSVKVNANIGSSPTSSSPAEEVEKLTVAERWGADTVMDLSTGKGLDATREAIIAASTVPIGTVPIYQALEAVKDPEDLTAELLLEVIEKQARQGVDYMTIHAGVRIEHLPLCEHRVTGIVSRGGGLLARWMVHHRQENWNAQFDAALDPGTARAMHDETLPNDHFKSAEFCSMCGPKYCPMHNFRDVDWRGLREVVAERKRARQAV